MFLGIEIGGTKLQLGVGAGDGALVSLDRFEVRPRFGAKGILEQIEASARVLIARHNLSAIGIGFGGPIDHARGVVVKSHHVEGWDHFALVEWCRRVLLRPANLQNDCDAAGLAEARFGAGRGRKVVLFVTVGTGIGGGLIVDGQIYRGNGAGAAEVGHLRPGLHADRPDQTVESLASGWGIAAAAQARLSDPISHAFIPLTSGLKRTGPDDVRQRLIETEEAAEEYTADLWDRCDGKLDQLTTLMVAQAAAEGNEVAREVLAHACQALGWGIAQAITLVSPEVIVIGGGVSLMDETLFLQPVRQEIDRYVFPPLLGTYQIVPAQLGEQVVVHVALAAAADIAADTPSPARG
ncbi:MAG: ROK family protein [Planctomycetia bacterium]|nr:ROK family protein [Planctomycetia bacterium]